MAEQTDHEAFVAKMTKCVTCINRIVSITENLTIQFALSFDSKKLDRQYTKDSYDSAVIITDANAPTLIAYEDKDPNSISGSKRLNGDNKQFYRSYELSECKDIPELQLINVLKAVQLTKQSIIKEIKLRDLFPDLYTKAILNDTQIKKTPDTQPLLTITALKSLAMPLDTDFRRTNYHFFEKVYAIYNCKLPNVNRCSIYHV